MISDAGHSLHSDGQRGRCRKRARMRWPGPLGTISAWDRAIVCFGAAWGLSPQERAALRLTLHNPTRRLDALVRELLAEAAGLALETGRADVAAWCYAACERITADGGARPSSWDEVAIERSLLEPLAPVALGMTLESLVWWSVRLVPRLAHETPDAACQRTARSALYLSVKVVQAFMAEDASIRARAALVATLGAVVARRSRAMVGAA